MYKHCLKCGANLQSAFEDGFQRHICNVCGWIFYNNPRPCVTAVIYQNQNILFIRRLLTPGKGKWDLPGGFMETGEHPEQTLKREILEEIGTEISSFQLTGFYPDVYDIEECIPILNIVYVCQINGVPNNESEEFDEIQWFSMSDLPKEYAFQSMPTILKDTLSFLSEL